MSRSYSGANRQTRTWSTALAPPFTFYCRVKFAALPAATTPLIQFGSSGTTNTNCWALRLTTTGAPQVFKRDAATTITDSGPPIATATWHTLLGTFDSDGFYATSQNGVNFTGTTDNSIIPVPAANILTFGGTNAFYTGLLSHIAIWQKRLSNADMQQVVALGPLAMMTSLHAYFPWMGRKAGDNDVDIIGGTSMDDDSVGVSDDESAAAWVLPRGRAQIISTPWVKSGAQRRIVAFA